MNISFFNETENDLIISIPNKHDDVLLSSGEKKDFVFDANFESFSVRKQSVELSKIQRILSYVVGTIVGVLLCLIYYSQIETLKDSVKFPVKFFLPSVNHNENVTVRLCNTSTTELCIAEINGDYLKFETLISKQALSDERKDYYESNITMFFVPFVAVLILSIAVVVHFKTIVAFAITVAVNLLLYLPLLIIIKKNRDFYKETLNKCKDK